MSEDQEDGLRRRSFARVPLRAKFRMEFEERRYFLSEYAFNIGPEGAFVKTEDPLPVGEVFLFETDLTRRGPRICGHGEVIWAREEEEGARRPKGLGIRFTEIEAEDRALLEELQTVFLEDGAEAMEARLEAAADAWEARRELDDDTTASLRFEDAELPETEPLPPVTDDEIERAIEEATAYGEPEDGVSEVAADVISRSSSGGLVAGVVVAAIAVALAVYWFVGRSASTPAEVPSTDVAVASTASTAPEVEVDPSSLVSFNAIESIDWEETGDELMVSIVVDGFIPPDSYDHFRLGGQRSREVIQLFGAGEGFEEQELAVDSVLVERIRTGFHPGDDRNEVRIVLDLARDDVGVTGLETDGTSLTVRVGPSPPTG